MPSKNLKQLVPAQGLDDVPIKSAAERRADVGGLAVTGERDKIRAVIAENSPHVLGDFIAVDARQANVDQSRGRTQAFDRRDALLPIGGGEYFKAMGLQQRFEHVSIVFLIFDDDDQVAAAIG